MKNKLLVMTSLVLMGCGSAPDSSQVGKVVDLSNAAPQGLSVVLQAGVSFPGALTQDDVVELASDAEVVIPPSLVLLANASENGTAKLTLGTIVCKYGRVGGAYQLNTCSNGALGGSKLPLKQGNDITLSIEAYGLSQNTLIQAVLQ